MLICAKEGCESKVIEIFEKYQLASSVIGEVSDTGFMELFWHNKKCGDIPIAPISSNAPVLNRKTTKPKYLQKLILKRKKKNNNFIVLNKKTKDIKKDFLKIFSSIYVSDKNVIYEQYDNTVQTNTILKTSPLDSTSIRIKQNNYALSMSIDCNERRCYIDPKKGATSSVIEACSNVAMSGAYPKAISDCLNYGSPLDSSVMWQFKKGVQGIKKACKGLNVPVVSGNVSFYNQTNTTAIYPTPTIASVGISKDANKILPSSFVKNNSVIVILGTSKNEFGGSLYDKIINNKVRGAHPKINLENTLNLWKTIFKANKKNLILSAKDINVGGEIIALAKICAVSDFGCEVNTLSKKQNKTNKISVFCESLDRAIISLDKNKLDKFKKLCKNTNTKIQIVGKTTKQNKFKINNMSFAIKEIKDIYFNSFKKYFKTIKK
jgi:phosphoribosylformylglycinamidine synthase